MCFPVKFREHLGNSVKPRFSFMCTSKEKCKVGMQAFFAFKERKQVCSFPNLYIHYCILAKINSINQSINMVIVIFRHGVSETCFNTNIKPKIKLLTMRTWEDSELVSILIFIQTNGTHIVFISYST